MDPRTGSATPRHLSLLVRIATLVAIGDYATKEAAIRFVGNEPTVFSEWLHFAVVHNSVGAFGLTLGAYTWQVNLALTLAAIALIVPVSRDLSRVDPMAPRALGLVVGGALGNLASLILSPNGVVDFIELTLPRGGGLVLNVADVAAYAGLAMILRTGFLIVGEMRRASRPVIRTMPELMAAPARMPRFADREVRLPVHRDGAGGEVAVVDPPVTVDLPLPSVEPEVDDQMVRVLPFPSGGRNRPAGERLLQVPPRASGRRRE